MITQIIGWFCLFWFAVSFVTAFVKGYRQDLARADANEWFMIGYLIAAAICFK